MQPLEGKAILVTGGTGSLGQILVRRLLSGVLGTPRRVTVFSRDEAKQHALRVEYAQRLHTHDDAIANNAREALDFRIGDIRDPNSVAAALRDVNVVFNAAALKQVPSCEYFPTQAVMTNVLGAENIVRAIQQHYLPVETVVGISTDKACKPVNVMGMTKALQERIFIEANIECPATRFICVRYGNVLATRGSVVPLFQQQIAAGGPITITTTDMTRFLLTIEQAVDTICAALCYARPGETYIPIIGSARVRDIADVMVGSHPINVVVTGIRPGEKIHEVLVSEEECHRTTRLGNYYVIRPNLPELLQGDAGTTLKGEFSSADFVMNRDDLAELLDDFIPAQTLAVAAPRSELMR